MKAYWDTSVFPLKKIYIDRKVEATKKEISLQWKRSLVSPVFNLDRRMTQKQLEGRRVNVRGKERRGEERGGMGTIYVLLYTYIHV